MFAVKVTGMKARLSKLDAVSQTIDSYRKNIPYIMAVELREALYQAISTQQFPVFYAAYNPYYERWKLKTVGHLDFWKLHGYLISSLRVWRSPSNGWAAGIMPGAHTPDGRKINEYAERVEKGDPPGLPGRPLFEPVRQEFYMNRMQEILKDAARTIESTWR